MFRSSSAITRWLYTCCHHVTALLLNGLRDYGLPSVWWPAVTFSPMAGLPPLVVPEQECCLGLEKDMWSYVGHLVAIFREVRRVLRDDGTLWLNLGDSYAGGGGFGGQGKTGVLHNTSLANRQGRGPISEGLKPKDLMGIPWRVALALQADGYYLRSDIIWHKVNCMPESVMDRPTKAHEYIFLLSKSERYFYDAEAIKEEAVSAGEARGGGLKYSDDKKDNGIGGHHNLDKYGVTPTGRNRRTVWTQSEKPPYEIFQDWTMNKLAEDTELYNALISQFEQEQSSKDDVWQIATQPYGGSHFAVFPIKLVEPMILASTSQEGVCGQCGSSWVRMIERITSSTRQNSGYTANCTMRNDGDRPGSCEGGKIETLGWQPSCQCNAPVVPAIILDPFMGSGTTAKVALANRRNFIGIDANPTYVSELAYERLNGTQIKLL